MKKAVLPKASASNDNYLRSSLASRTASSPRKDLSNKKATSTPEQPSPSSFSMEVTLDFDAGPGSIPTSTIAPSGCGSSTQSNLALKPRNLKSPSELGIPVSEPEQRPQAEPTRSVARILRSEQSGVQQRTLRAIQSLRSMSAPSVVKTSLSLEEGSSKICSVAYLGQEMLFCVVGDEVVAMCSRTRVTLQFLVIPKEADASSGPSIVLLCANPATAQVLVGLSNGLVYTFHPVPTSTKHASSLSSAHARYRWINGPVIDSRPIFVSLDDCSFHDFQVSSSEDYKVLLGHGDQLAVYVVSPPKDKPKYDDAEVLWTTRLERPVLASKISGDGQSIVYVLQGDGFENGTSFGARTFLRDFEDGAPSTSDPTLDLKRSLSSLSIGIVYKPGPILVHSSSVTQISFRGFGRTTSSATCDQDEGNDLLLTYCDGDNTARVFSQSSWKQLIQWTTPPCTRADWVRGISAFNLGDLEPRKGVKKSSPSQPTSRRPSMEMANSLNSRSMPPTHTHPVPSTLAGAWIAEITFRSALPALRLSRLSYLKRGSEEAFPAHFESVSAILPYGSILPASVLNMGEMGLSIQGVWPAWHPWLSEGTQGKMDGTLSGSAMSFLGLSGGNVALNGFFGDNYQGGTHSPPSELRIIASHPKAGTVVLMEFPLWGDQDFGAMELGSPMRYVMSLSDSFDSKRPVWILDYELDKLCAQIDSDSESVSIIWRRQGTQLLFPEFVGDDDAADPEERHKVFSDLSVLPVPLILPSLKLTSTPCQIEDEKFMAVQWWPDENYGGPPQMLCICRSGTLLVYELPPPWSALEPTMPGYDPVGELSLTGSVGVEDEHPPAKNDDGEALDEYEVMVVPHQEFGIGLRLEAQADGKPAIAGSYKMHPLNGGSLPAEKTGLVVLGDELVSVNGISLEGFTFDDIIAKVRQAGSDNSPGAPLCLKFRPVVANRHRANSNLAFSSADNSEQSNRRSREQILGFSPAKVSGVRSETPSPQPFDESPLKSALRLNADIQQDFARVIARVPCALSEFHIDDAIESLVLLLPWLYHSGSPSDLRGAALLVVFRDKKLQVSRLEVSADCNPEKARCVDVGSFDLDFSVTKIFAVSSHSRRWCIGAFTDTQCCHLVFLDAGETDDSLVTIRLFAFCENMNETCIFRSFSTSLIGAMDSASRVPQVEVWSALPHPLARENHGAIGVLDQCQNSHTYTKTVLSLTLSSEKVDKILDFRFVSSGSLDGYPWILLLTTRAALVYVRPAADKVWKPILSLQYPKVPSSNTKSTSRYIATVLSPLDSIPHLIAATKYLIEFRDDTKYLRADWQPDSILSYVCTDCNGPLHALRSNVTGIFHWLAQNGIESRQQSDPNIESSPRFVVTPFRYVGCNDFLAPPSEEETIGVRNDTASGLFTTQTFAARRNEEDSKMKALAELQRCLCPGEVLQPASATPLAANDKERHPPSDFLQCLNADEIRLLWAIGELLSKFPDFKGLDASAQHAFFCISLLRKIKEAPNAMQKEDYILRVSRKQKAIAVGGSSFVFPRRRDFMLDHEEKRPKQPSIALSGVLAALASRTQKVLIDKCRPVGGQYDWETARALRMPLWIRSTSELRKIADEIGKAMYLKTKDLLECALFFVVSGSLRTLKNLSLADRTDSGRKFANFLTGHDFSSPHGRKIVEKNAYSLLAKNRYNVAAAFFLLAQPPMLTTAVQILVSKSGDFDLAFMVSRLVEAESGSQMSGGLLLGSFGGGGGYSAPSTTIEQADEVSFEVWVPSIESQSKALLRDQDAQVFEEARTFDALKLIWLGCKEEAATVLAGIDHEETSDYFPQSFDTPIKEGHDVEQELVSSFPFHASTKKELESANDRVIRKSNQIINFVSKPFLLRAIHASVRSRWAGTLLVSQALTRRGIELPAIRCLLQNTNEVLVDDEGYVPLGGAPPLNSVDNRWNSAFTSGTSQSTGQAARLISHSIEGGASETEREVGGPETGVASSSIFDTFDVSPAVKSERSSQAPINQMSSSIFDSYNTAPSLKAIQPSQASMGQMSSSIFDSYDTTPPVKAIQTSQASTGQVSSSIFDSYDIIPPVKAIQTSQPSPGQMSSSIFDSYDTRPPGKAIQTSQALTGPMSSSIFDSYVTTPPVKAIQTYQASTGQMSSSIFDSYDTAPPVTAIQTSQASAGQMSSSIFDSFETAPPVHAMPKSQASTGMPLSNVVNSGFAKPSTTSSLIDSQDNPSSTKPSTSTAILIPGNIENTADQTNLPSSHTPLIWEEWRRSIIIWTVARRVLREAGRHINHLSQSLADAPIQLFSSTEYPFVPLGGGEILHIQCDGQDLLDKVCGSVMDICSACGLETTDVVNEAIRILDSQAQSTHIGLATLLHALSDRPDLAEDCIRDAAVGQMRRCDAFALNYDDLAHSRKTVHHTASQHLRRAAIRISWQLELCLWLHRGGVFPLSSTVLKEAIIAVRIGLVVASWGRNHVCLDDLIRYPPDCPLDHNGGRQLWTSLKLIVGLEEKGRKVGNLGSGGWEFLVNCQREEATAMLRNRTCGSFIIRPHAEDDSVFTLSFKTNLMPLVDDNPHTDDPDNIGDSDGKAQKVKVVKKSEVVQHAIIRLSDAGFRCGSFGPFTTLMKLLEAVSASLPFDLLFDKPPIEGIIKDEEHQPSPNGAFLRKFAISWASDATSWCGVSRESKGDSRRFAEELEDDRTNDDRAQLSRFGVFCQLLTLSEIRKQLCAVAAGDYDDFLDTESGWNVDLVSETDSAESLTGDGDDMLGLEERYACASRILRPFLVWCQTAEVRAVHMIAPGIKEISHESREHPCALVFTESSIELAPHQRSSILDGGDAMIRNMIQPGSGVEFRTLRVGEGGDSAMIVLFSKHEAVSWLMSNGLEKTEKDALNRLARMEERRVIEPIALSDLNLKAFTQNQNQERREEISCYRFVDPWEVEALGNREGETKAAALGREHYLAFSVQSVENCCESILRKLGGSHLLGLWSNEHGGLRLTKAIASVHPPWERDAGSDLQMSLGRTVEPTAFQNAIRQHLYRNALFRRLTLTQRFLALVQVELLDLKNLTAPGGTNLAVYALLRLKRQGSSAPLTQKARTLDSAATQPAKIGKTTGPNAPASWGSLVRFRFPLPEDVNCDGTSFDADREALFKGPPCILQLSVYEKKFITDTKLGGADVKLDALTNGGQMEEWVPLRSQTHGVNWFVRMRLTLRFELMCLPSDGDDELPPSVGLTKIQKLSKAGGTHEGKVKKSTSTPDILSYFESMVY